MQVFGGERGNERVQRGNGRPVLLAGRGQLPAEHGTETGRQGFPAAALRQTQGNVTSRLCHCAGKTGKRRCESPRGIDLHCAEKPRDQQRK